MSGVKITLIQIVNIGKIKFMDFSLKGLTRVVGPNGAAKSTVLKAIEYAFNGAKSIPEGVIRKGVQKEGKNAGKDIDRASIRIELDNGIVVDRTIRIDNKGNQKEDLSVTGSNVDLSSQKLLDKITSIIMNPQVVSDMNGVELFKELQKITGFDTSDYDLKIAKYTEDNKFVRKQIKNRGVLEELTYNRPEKLVDVVKLSETINKLDKVTEQKGRLIDNIDVLEKDMANWEDQIEGLKKSIESSEIELKGKKSLIEEIEKAQNPIDLAAKKETLRTSSEINTKFRAWEKYDLDLAAETKLKKELKTGEDDLKKENIAKDKYLSTLNVPEGMFIDKGSVIVNAGEIDGQNMQIPWENASESLRAEFAFRLCVSAIPKDGLQLLYYHRGESIGSERMKAIAELANEHNVDILMEVMSETPVDETFSTVYLSEGDIVKTNVEKNDKVHNAPPANAVKKEVVPDDEPLSLFDGPAAVKAEKKVDPGPEEKIEKPDKEEVIEEKSKENGLILDLF